MRRECDNEYALCGPRQSLPPSPALTHTPQHGNIHAGVYPWHLAPAARAPTHADLHTGSLKCRTPGRDA